MTEFTVTPALTPGTLLRTLSAASGLFLSLSLFPVSFFSSSVREPPNALMESDATEDGRGARESVKDTVSKHNNKHFDLEPLQDQDKALAVGSAEL